MVFVSQAAKIVGGVVVTMLGQLMTASFIKSLIVRSLEIVVKKTKTEEDDKILQDAKRAWGMSD